MATDPWGDGNISNAQLKDAGGGRITLADRGVGTLLLVAGAINVTAARTTVFTLPALVLAAVATAYWERTPFRGVVKPVPDSVPVALLLGFAVLSAAWSAHPGAALAFTLLILLVFVQWHIVNHWMSVQPDRRIHHLAYWFPVAILIGLAILFCEVFAHQLMRRMIVENFGVLTPPTLSKHYTIDASGRISIVGFELNRSIAALNLFLWPAVLCAASYWSGRKFAWIAVALVGGVLLTTAGSNHETSKIAVVAGIVCFAAAHYRRRVVIAGAAVVWVLLVVGMVFAARIAHDDLALHKAPWLQSTAQARIVIWNDIAGRVLDSPFIGVGARGAYVLSAQESQPFNEHAEAREEARAIPRHAHNMYLQTWFELGIVGAALLLAAGLAALRAVTKIHATAQPYALATFAVFMVEIGSSWEIWQRWYAALLALTMIHLTLGIRSLQARVVPP